MKLTETRLRVILREIVREELSRAGLTTLDGEEPADETEVALKRSSAAEPRTSTGLTVHDVMALLRSKRPPAPRK